MNGSDAKYQKDNIQIENRSIWCDMLQTLQHVRDCKKCQYRENCTYREKGAMRRIKIDWDNIILK